MDNLQTSSSEVHAALRGAVLKPIHLLLPSLALHADASLQAAVHNGPALPLR